MNTLPIKSSKEAALEAKKEIDEGRSDNVQSLKTRFKAFDNAIGGWRFNTQIVLAGMSGSGKSFMLNMIRKDFANKELNGTFHKPFKQLHFAFEMSASDEIIRSASSDTKTSYGDLISAYEKLSDKKYKQVIEMLKLYAELDIDYVEVTGTVQQISDTIDQYQGKYPEYSLIISLDHTLLTDYMSEKDEIQLVSNLSRMMLKKRNKFSSLNIIISQLNAEIEKEIRLLNKELHFPTKRDLHGSKSVYRDADVVSIIHSPEKLGVQSYGRQNYITKDIVFNHIIKNRKFGKLGVRGMRQDFANGNLIELEENQYKI